MSGVSRPSIFFSGGIFSIKDERKTKRQLIAELDELRRRVAELEELEVERKETENALHESEKRVRQLAENIEGAFWIGTPETGENRRLLYVSPGFEKLFGVKAEDVRESDTIWVNAVHEQDRDRVVNELERFLEGHGNYDVEYRISLPDGSVRWIWARAFAVRDDKGEVSRTVGLAQDITRLKQLEEELRIREQAIKSIADNVPGLVSYIDAGGCYRYVNRRYQEYFGLTASRIIGKHYKEVLGEEVYEIIKDRVDTVLSGRPASYEELLPYRHGGKRWVKAEYVPDTDAEGKIRGFFALVLDITERKMAEEGLRESSHHWQSTFEAISDGVCLQDREGIILRCNKATADLLGRPSDQIIGRTCCEALHGRRKTTDRCPFARMRETLRRESLTFQVADKHLQVVVDPILDDDGKLEGAVHIMSDVTEERRLRHESEQRLQQLIETQRLAALGEVVAGVAHEINNPNSFITYNIPLLEETWDIFEPILRGYSGSHPGLKKDGISFDELLQDMREIVEAIKLGSERISRVVDNPKDFARLDESTHTRPVQVNEVIAKTLVIVGAQLRKCVESKEVNLAGDLPEIQGHFQKLERWSRT